MKEAIDLWTVALKMFALALMGGSVLLAVWLIGWLALYQSAQTRCLHLGFHEARMTWDYRPFCASRVDRTEIFYLMPLERAERGAR